MRVIHEQSLQGCKLTFFAWNNRYLIKIELGQLEQTFKVDQFDFENDDQVVKLADAEFIHQAVNRFRDMGQSLHAARERVGI